MALLGWSLILASIVYLAIRRPPFVETLVALCRGSPRIQQPPSTRPPSERSEASDRGRGHSSAVSITRQDASARRRAEADRSPIPKISSLPLEVQIEVPTDEPSNTETPAVTIASSPQTTPRPQLPRPRRQDPSHPFRSRHPRYHLSLPRPQ